MIEIRTLRDLDADALKRIVAGYTSTAKYVVNKTERREITTITLELTTLDQPYVKRFDYNDEMLERYRQVVQQGFSLGAYSGSQTIGIAIAEKWDWNRSLWVWEFGVAETHRRMGIGKRLMEAVADEAKEADLRVIICETQNTNVPAIEFYRKVGFEIEGIDLSYYDMTEEVAVFMKRELAASPSC
jgi:ribosomal protein S18 acetylase RimI-like enzyme